MNGSIEWLDRRVFVALGAILASSSITGSIFARMHMILEEVSTFVAEPTSRGIVLEGMPDVLGSLARDIVSGIVAIIAGGVVGFIIHIVILRSTRP